MANNINKVEGRVEQNIFRDHLHRIEALEQTIQGHVTTIADQHTLITGLQAKISTLEAINKASQIGSGMHQLLQADPALPDDRVWYVREGVSPSMVISTKARVNGKVVTVASVTV